MCMPTTRRALIAQGGGAIGVATLSSLGGCTLLGLGGGGDSIGAASMQWTEAQLMGYLGYESLKANTDLTIENEISLGGSQQCFQAVKNGEVDFYHLYTGGAYLTIPPKREDIPRDPEELYQRAKEDMREEHGLEYLERAQFNNTYALAARPGWQEETGLETMSDFADYVNSGNTDFTVVLGPEFAEREDGWPGLAEAYGFADAADDLNINKIGADLTYQTLGEGEADVGMVFTTNAQIQKYDLVTLEDDQNFFPAYNPAPLANGDTVEEFSQIVEPLEAPMRALDSEEKVIDLNARIELEDEDVQDVAVDFLESEDII